MWPSLTAKAEERMGTSAPPPNLGVEKPYRKSRCIVQGYIASFELYSVDQNKTGQHFKRKSVITLTSDLPKST